MVAKAQVSGSATDLAGAALTKRTVLVEVGGVVDGAWTPLSAYVSDTEEPVDPHPYTTDAAGQFTMVLYPNPALTPPNTTYRITREGADPVIISVPDAGTYQVLDLRTVDPPQPGPVIIGKSTSATDNGDGTFTLDGFLVVDHGDGTYTVGD